MSHKGQPESVLTLKLVRMADRTPRIRQFLFESNDGAALPSFTAGAHVELLLPGGRRRAYSLVNSPAEVHRYVLAIQREDAGNGGSTWIFENLKPGDTVDCTVPVNDFPLDASARRHIFIAGGIGITPFISMARHLIAAGGEFQLYYCTRSPEVTVFLDKLPELLGERLHVHHDGGDPSRGLDFGGLLAQQREGDHVYICGPKPFIDAARAAASHWAQGSVHIEVFAPALAIPADDAVDLTGAAPFDVVLNKSGKRVRVGDDETLLQALERAGFHIHAVCLQGWCGTCRTKYISGKVDHKDEYLDEQQRKSLMQVCISRALPGETLVLDI